MCLEIKSALETLLHNIPEKIKTCYIAYSGGLDSTVLLHGFLTAQLPQLEIRVLHVNHQLNPQASLWEQHCKDTAIAYGLPYATERVTVTHEGKGIEAAARQARYDVFMRYAQPNCAIITAHHGDDQLETLLLHILRGTGIRGLSGMAAQRRLNQGYLLRPLLSFRRDQLQRYARYHQLTYITDPSNFDTYYTRNLLRQRVLPLLQQDFPNVAGQLLALQANAKEADTLLTEYANQLFQMCQLPDIKQLNLTQLITFSQAQQHLVLRYWLMEVHGLMAPSRTQLIQMQQQLVNSRADQQPCFKLNTKIIRRYQNRLYLMPIDAAMVKGWYADWNLEMPLVTPVGTLAPEPVRQAIALPDNVQVQVRFRQGGERFHPDGRVGSHPLKKCFQEWRVPPWQRDYIPLIYFNGECIYIYGYAAKARAQPS